MKWLKWFARWPQRTLVPAVLLLIALLTTLLAYTGETEEHQQVLHRSALRSLRHEVHQISQLLEYLIQRGDWERVQHELAELGALPGVNEALLVDSEGLVLAAIPMEKIGQRLSLPLHGQTLDQPNRFLSDGLLLRAYQSLVVKRSETRPRPQRDGWLYVEQSLADNYAEARSQALWETAGFAAFAISTMLLMWLYFSQAVTRRLESVAASAGRLAQGDFTVRIAMEGKDEFSRLARAFNHMADALEAAWNDAERQRALLAENNSELACLKLAMDEHATVSMTTVDGDITYVNDKFCQSTGYSREELIGQNHRIFKSGVHEAAFYRQMWEIISAGQVWQGLVENKHKDGSHVWMQLSIVPIFGPDNAIKAYIGMRTDVSQLERLRRAMEILSAFSTQKTETYGHIVAAAGMALNCRWVGIDLLDRKTGRLYNRAFWANGAAADAGAYPWEDAPWRSMGHVAETLIVAEQARQRFPQAAVFERLQVCGFLSQPLVGAGGELLGVLFAMGSAPLAMDQGKQAFLNLVKDRSAMLIQQEKTELQLIESEKRFRKLFESSAQATLIMENGVFINANNAALEMLRLGSVEQILGVAPAAISPERQPDGQVSMAKAQAMVALAYDRGSHRFEWEHRRADGEHFLAEVLLTPILHEGREMLHVVWRDITDRKRLEAEQARLQAQLQQAQKMEAIGQLTGGIAHDFNNILAAILGYTGLALDRYVPDKDSKLAAYLYEVRTAGERARDLIANMLAFSRGAKGESVALAAAPLVREVCKTLRSVIPSGIEIDMIIDEPVPAVLGDPVQLHQVLMNLAINARDAIGEHGRIEIRLRYAGKLEDYCSSCHHRLQGDYVELAVSDDGGGIAPENLPRVFDPFFTTKEVGKGTGMGLSMVHGIMHEHGGHICLQSRPGRGATFSLLFPVASQAQGSSGRVAARGAMETAPLRARVMIVDDEVAVGNMLAEVLRNCGHQAGNYSDSLAALADFTANPNAWDVVVTDQTMPGLSGAEMAQRMLSLRPDIPIILCTGYSDSIDETGAGKLGICRFFAKPVDTSALCREIVRLMERSKAVP
jgi:PAS domain S-box-containing protein